MEVWKNIKNCSNYQVSNYGNIKSLERYVNTGSGQRLVKERILKLGKDKDGYNILCFNIEDYKKTYKIHRLVAEHFLEKKEGFNIVNHKDLNKNNNNVLNLEYVTEMINTRHYHKTKNNKCVGVSFDKSRNKYKCRISVNGKRIYLGVFDSEDNAIKTYYDYVFNNKLNIINYY